MGRSVVRATQPVEQFFQFSLLGLLVSSYCALAGSGSVDLPTLLFTGIGFLVRLLLIMGVVRLDIHPRWTTAATVLYIGFYPLDVMYVSREFIPATVHLICFLAVVRVLTATTNRDYFFVKVIAFLQLLAATLLSDNLSFFIFLTLFVIFGVATFCCSEIRRSSQLAEQTVVSVGRFHGKLTFITAAVTVGIVLMTSGLFLLLPRTARAAFRTLISERYHLPGFSNEITLGQIGELKQQSTPMFHAKIEAPNDRLSLKWRGSALTQFDGKRWYNPRSRFEQVLLTNTNLVASDDQRRRRDGARVNYIIRFGQIDTDTMFFAGIPEVVEMNGLRSLVRGPGETYRSTLIPAEGRSYSAISYLPSPDALADPSITELTPQAFNEHLKLPPTDQRVIDLAQEIGTGATTIDRTRAIEKYLRTRFGYTTELLSEPVNDPLAHFLFTRRKGHCEYFASAMAVMLRAVHIPSRVATGFQGGQFNPMTGWHVVRASDAHSWVEAWIPGRGWLPFDPTPPDTSARNGLTELWSHVLLYLDAGETMWRQWVVDYDLERQIELVASVEQKTRRLSGGALLDRLRDSATDAADFARIWAPWAMAAIVLGVALVLFGPRVWSIVMNRRYAARIAKGGALASDAALLYERMLLILRRRGVEKPGWLTPGEFARIIPSSPASPLVEQITTAYNDLRFGRKPDAGPRMIQLLQDLESCK